jgi:hypothetical protein
VIALDADGNLTLNLGVLGTVANESPKNLTVIVMDNGNYLGSHKDEPGMPTATGGKMNLEGVARQCGIASSSTVQDVESFRDKLQSALSQPGPHFIDARIEALDSDRPARAKRIADPRQIDNPRWKIADRILRFPWYLTITDISEPRTRLLSDSRARFLLRYRAGSGCVPPSIL